MSIFHGKTVPFWADTWAVVVRQVSWTILVLTICLLGGDFGQNRDFAQLSTTILRHAVWSLIFVPVLPQTWSGRLAIRGVCALGAERRSCVNFSKAKLVLSSMCLFPRSFLEQV